MAATNFTRTQGETWRITLSLTDSDGVPQQLADASFVPSIYWSGVATKTGQTDVPVYFQYLDSETITYGRGEETTVTGVYKLYAYIPADEVGSCSDAQYTDRVSCEVNTETWTVDAAASLLTTTQMVTGDWDYEIRMSDAIDPSNLESSKVLLYGTLTMEESTVDISAGSSFTFQTPSTPT